MNEISPTSTFFHFSSEYICAYFRAIEPICRVFSNRISGWIGQLSYSPLWWRRKCDGFHFRALSLWAPYLLIEYIQTLLCNRVFIMIMIHQSRHVTNTIRILSTFRIGGSWNHFSLIITFTTVYSSAYHSRFPVQTQTFVTQLLFDA